MPSLWKMPGAIAEYTVGTMIVLFQVGVLQPLDERRRRDRRPRLGTRRPARN